MYRFKFTILVIAFTSTLGYGLVLKPQQTLTQLKPSYKANQLLEANKNEDILVFCKKEIPKLLKAPEIDSLEIAELYKYQNKAYYQLGDYLESIKSIEKAINFCNETEEGRLLKGQLYSDKASAYNYTEKDKATFNSTLNAIKYLRSVKKPDYDYLITSYRYLSEQCAYHGNTDDAKRYLRQAEELYRNNKKEVDSVLTRPDGYRYKYDIILLYSKVYQLYKYGKTVEDSLEVVKSIQKFDELHAMPDFSVEHDGIYYTTALNHIGDWYASRKPEALTTKEDLEKAHYYLDKSIDYIENKGYPGNIFTHKYNKVKTLALSNEVNKADALISELLNLLSENDGRKPYFLAQKALIKAKQKQKDSTVKLFFEALEIVHSDSIDLDKDLNNFKPSTNYGHTNLILRIAEELDRYFIEDSTVQKTIAQLYPMAFLQFERSYDKRKFNKSQKAYLRQIVKGILKTKKLGYNQHIDHSNILNRFENIQNLLAWEKFNKNRQINNFPELDSLQLRNYKLRSLIAEAKSNARINAEDSLKTVLNQTEKYTKETFPNLSLFNTTNFKVEDLQSQLKQNQLVLKYILFDNQMAIYEITKDAVNVTLKSWSEDDRNNLNDFINQLKQKQFNRSDAQRIAQLILPDIADGIEHLIINPDDDLNKLAFEVLSKNKQLLIAQYNLSYTSNLGFIFPKVYQNQNNNKLAIYAPEYPKSDVKLAVRSQPAFLEGAQKESELISQLFSSNLYNGKQLTKRDFIETASQYKLLHLAMHAIVDDTQSGISRLLFSDDASQTDDLYLEELYGLNLSADLAVLSACNTGIDNTNAETGIESFQRAFTFAGVPATVASLWEVPDQSTKQIMVNFYENLKNGDSKSLALKNAKLEYIKANKNTKLANPYYWAGFVIYGEDSAITQNTSNVLAYGLMSSIVLLIGFGLVIRKRRKQSA